MQIFLFIALIISALAILFAAQNNDLTSVSFIVWDFESSLAFILVVALAVGALISFFVSLPTNIRVRWALRNQKKKIGELEKNLTEAKTRTEELQQQLDAANAPAVEPIQPVEPVLPVVPAPVAPVESIDKNQPADMRGA